MARPKISDEDRLCDPFKVAFNEATTLEIKRRAKILGVAPAAFIRIALMSKKNVFSVDDNLKFSVAH